MPLSYLAHSKVILLVPSNYLGVCLSLHDINRSFHLDANSLFIPRELHGDSTFTSQPSHDDSTFTIQPS
jgi:hypothetical protein